jgi:hypothetical protein
MIPNVSSAANQQSVRRRGKKETNRSRPERRVRELQGHLQGENINMTDSGPDQKAPSGFLIGWSA